MTKKHLSKIIIVLGILLSLIILSYKILYPVVFEAYTGVVNAELSYESSIKISESEFEALVYELNYQANYEKAAKIIAADENNFSRKTCG